MKKILALLLLIASILGLISCSKNDDDIPDGMQLVRGGEDIGYYMYAPEEWTVSNQGDISAAYVSNVDTTSITYTETDMPEFTEAGEYTEAVKFSLAVKNYFDKNASEFPASMKFKVVTANRDTTFGNADNAVMYEYDVEYSEHKFRVMQIFTKYGERFGIFTFTSVLENMSSDDTVQYDYYKEKRDKVISNFKYVKKTGTAEEPKYETDGDGYKLISDKSVCKFSLYVPQDFKVNYSSGIVSASLPDGSNVNVSRATSTGVSVDKYWENRREELSEIVSNITVQKGVVDGEEKELINIPATLGNCKQAFSYEYTYEYNGNTYHVYQLFGVKGLSGFAFTYTAKEENYIKHIDVIKTIAEKVEF